MCYGLPGRVGAFGMVTVLFDQLVLDLYILRSMTVSLAVRIQIGIDSYIVKSAVMTLTMRVAQSVSIYVSRSIAFIFKR